MGKIIGLDVGIGSLGWAIVDEENRRIVDLGVRIFESGEEGARKAADRASQIRRAQRSSKRLNRRTKQRKIRLKLLLQGSGVISVSEIHYAYQQKGFNPDTWRYRAEGLDRKLQPLEIASVLINFANYRGYRDFYEDSEENNEGKLTIAKNTISEAWQDAQKTGKYRSMGEMVYKDEMFNSTGELIIRNRARRNKEGKKETDYKYLINRYDLIEECRLLLNKQFEYGYDAFTPDFVSALIHIIFEQRDFEDGPGPNKENRISQREAMLQTMKGQQKYSGFDELVGQCPFYPEEKRGYKDSLIYDMYVLVNDLSQLRFFSEGKEVICPETMVREIFTRMFETKGTYTMKEFKELCKKHRIEVEVPVELKKKNLSSAKFIRLLTDDKFFPSEYQKQFASEEFDDEKSLSSQIGFIMAKYATPKRRKDEFEKLFPAEECKALHYFREIKVAKSGGGASVSFKYMKEAIEAFFNGEKYGDFQARFNKDHPRELKHRLLTSDGYIRPILDQDMMRNPVVYRSLNETRKIINAIRRQYKDVTKINIEVAKEVGQSFEQRAETAKFQQSNLKKNEQLRDELASKLVAEGFDVSLSDKLITKFTLWKSQDMKCMYSGKDIAFNQLLNSTLLQVDHIIPQSIVLDETLNNKVLVFTEENQRKGNGLPLEYMDEEQKKEFSNRVFNLNRKGSISRAKKDYLLLAHLDNEVVSGFVDRNLNDTRAISKYMADFLGQAYKNQISVQVLKGAVTSRFRKKWLRRGKKYNTTSVYGLDEKARDLHYYHHAIDAVIIANMTRPYIEIAQDYEKLSHMRTDIGRLGKEGQAATAKRLSDELNEEIQKSVLKMKKFYGFDEQYTLDLLCAGYVPSICTDLRGEIEARVPLEIDADVQGYEEMCTNFKNLKQKLRLAQLDLGSDDEEMETYIAPDLLDDINAIVGTVCKNVTCIKENGQIVYENKELSSDADRKRVIKEFNAFCNKLSMTPLNEYIHSIRMLSEDEYAQRVEEYYEDKEFASSVKLPYVSFKIDKKYRGNMVASDNPVALHDTGYSSYKDLEKAIKEDLKCPYYIRFNQRKGERVNFTIYDARSYYCMETYIDSDGKYQVRGIRYVDVKRDRKNGHLVLKKPLPDGCKHVVYLFKNEYIKVYKKGKLINNGFGAYRGVENINQNTGKIRLYSNNNLKGRDVIINLASEITKQEISLLGHYQGVQKCGDQSLFTTENV